VRAADGIIATFDVPGASMSNAQGTYPRSINPEGDIAGFYYEASHIVVSTRGFVRADGTITTFDAGPNLGTIPLSINPSGEITGVYTEAIGAYHGFLREPHGGGSEDQLDNERGEHSE
jgi:hypothetical protein